ncbi:MAG: VWA domain-containing protein [Candidatus Kapabacteria bacterium]|nr:VWA domain-containing protein [Candidatus Kapabacteria bacterium]
MNFLNPLVLLGMAAAGIPILLHLLNLRRLKTIDFSTVRFLQELQQTRVRRLRVQQILLLILRTLVILFAVLAFARPTIPGSLPLLSVEARSSVVILVDNSASMEAADQRGERFRQARRAAQSIISLLKDGDEVAVLPLADRDAGRAVEFTRSFTVATEALERLALADGRADVAGGLQAANMLFTDAAHAHHEVYIVSDAQRDVIVRNPDDTSRQLTTDANVMLVRIGSGDKGLEQNLSVDSVAVLTRLVQPDKPVEVEAFIRNGSTRDASNVMVTLAFDGTRVAQQALDIPAGALRSIVVAAPPQRRGVIAAGVELENDAIDRDNIRYAGITILQRARVAIIGSGAAARLAQVALSVPGLEGSLPVATMVDGVRALGANMRAYDVVVLADATLGGGDAALLQQFVQQGGGLVVFAGDDASTADAVRPFGLTVESVRTASAQQPWMITGVVRTHPLFAGVFKGSTDAGGIAESPRLTMQRPAAGGATLMKTPAGPFVSEGTSPGGRVIYVAASPRSDWGGLGATGIFPMLLVRSVLYASMPRDAGIEASIGERVQAPIPPRMAGTSAFSLIDVNGIRSAVAAMSQTTGDVVMVPAQYRAGVVKVLTEDSAAVLGVTIHRPVQESALTFLDDAAWKRGVADMVRATDRVVVVDAANGMERAVQHARIGSELWPLFIVLALLCAVAEMAVARFWATESADTTMA